MALDIQRRLYETQRPKDVLECPIEDDDDDDAAAAWDAMWTIVLPVLANLRPT